MATATLIAIPVYQINSNQIVDRNLFPYGKSMYFAGATLNVQPNSFTSLQQLQAGGQAGAALIYSAILSSATGTTVFYSNLTPSAIAALANA